MVEKALDPKQLLEIFERLQGYAKSIQDYYESVCKFLNRETYKDYTLSSKPEDPYFLKAFLNVPNLFYTRTRFKASATNSNIMSSEAPHCCTTLAGTSKVPEK